MDALKNPPAFPSQLHEATAPGDHDPEPGMTLRDYFAGQALISMGTWMPPNDHGGFRELDWEETLRNRSAWAYRQADAMLAERAKKGGAA